MKIILIAWRNIFRRKRRTIIMLAALIIGLAGFVVFQGYIEQFMSMYRDQTIRSGMGHLQIASDYGYFRNGVYNPYDYSIQNEAGKISTLRTDPDVLTVIPATGFTSVAAYADKTVTLLVKGYPVEDMHFTGRSGGGEPSRKQFTLGTLEDGSLPEPDERDTLILGKTAARILGAEVGDVVTLMAMLPADQVVGRDFIVKALYASPGLDKNFAYTDFETAKDFITVQGASVIHVLAESPDRVNGIISRLAPRTVYRTWHDLAQYWVDANTILAGFQDAIRAIILLVTLFISANLINRIVYERIKEFGTLRAFGTKKSSILILIVLEGCFLGFAGAVLGTISGFAVSFVINAAGGLPFIFQGQHYMTSVMATPRSIILNIWLVVFVAGAAAFLPGLRAIRLSPAECLRQ